MNNTLLEFKNLVTEFHTEGKVVTAVNNISFTLNKGETIGVVGESGSGKSVTSLSAMRLVPSPPVKFLVVKAYSIKKTEKRLISYKFPKKKCANSEVMK